jgi:hypothetical protein
MEKSTCRASSPTLPRTFFALTKKKKKTLVERGAQCPDLMIGQRDCV